MGIRGVSDFLVCFNHSNLNTICHMFYQSKSKSYVFRSIHEFSHAAMKEFSFLERTGIENVVVLDQHFFFLVVISS